MPPAPIAIGQPFNPHGMFNGIWIPENLLCCPEIGATGKLLYGRLARFAGQDGRCFPGIDTLARELGMTTRQIQRLITELCEAGFLRKEPQYRRNGSQSTNSYVFLYHAALAPVGIPDQARWGEKNVTPQKRDDANVTGPLTETSPLLKRSSLREENSNTNSSRGPLAAAPSPEEYPLTHKQILENFPRTTFPVVRRILRAVLAVCPESTDEDIAAAVYRDPDQASPGLWAHTLPDRVREANQRRIVATRSLAPPACVICRDAGIVWESNNPSWCPATCDASVRFRSENPDFTCEWNKEFRNFAISH
jgi:hypothetical protein